MNICQCGAGAGYPHDVDCPYPLYGDDAEAVAKWKRAMYEKWLKRFNLDTAKVVIGVRGGVADVESAPDWIDVEIRDYDNNPDLDDETEFGEDYAEHLRELNG